MKITTTQNERGFSLVETMIAMGIMATALLSLAAVFAMGLRHLANSTPSLLAREKAREAVESVHTARDTRLITWAQINNAPSGVFLTGEKPMYRAGTDGLVNTNDDAAAGLEELIQPGQDGKLGTTDDIKTPLATYTRQIEITNLTEGGQVNPTLRQLRVTIRYKIGSDTRAYVLTTYISSIS